MTDTLPSLELGHDDANALLACQNEVLELMAGRAPLPVLLDCITSALETLMPGTSCSLLLLDKSSQTLRHGSAPSLPLAYLHAIDGLAPGPAVGSCGTAAHLAEAVVVADITTDPRWEAFRPAALAAGLRACWSTPVLGSSAAVVGTFAVYHRVPHEPTSRERLVVDRLTYLASVAIGHAAMLGELTMSEERFRRAFEDTAVAMALLDTDGRCTRVNDAFARLTGCPSELVARTPFVAFADREGHDVLAQAVAEVCSGRRRSQQCEVRVIGPYGRRPIVSMMLSAVRDEGGEPAEVSVSMVDVTERLAAEEERHARRDADLARRTAEQANAAKSDFLWAVSHEMRTPLQAITGFAELLGTLELDEPRRREALRHITDGARHLLELVDDTLDLARIEAAALPLAIADVALHDIVAEVLDFLSPVADQHGVRVVRAPAGGVAAADHRRLRQVLINLVSNAIRYSGVDGEVRVGAAACGDVVQIVVSDNGPGIAPDLRARLFEPFTTRLQHSPARGAPAPGADGVGLGLMLAKGLTEAMHGRLALADGPDGRGTAATVTLPIARA